MLLEDFAATRPEPSFQHLLFSIEEEEDRSTFARTLSRRLDTLTRAGATIVSISTTVIRGDEGLLRSAYVVIRMDKQTLATLRGDAPAEAPIPLDPDGGGELIGFPYPQGNSQSTP